MPDASFPSGAALVVGGTGGLGRAICLAFAAAGSPVAFTWHRRAAAADDLAGELSARGVSAQHWPLALGDYAAVESRLAEIRSACGRIHSIVYAAGPRIAIDYFGRLDPAAAAVVLTEDAVGFLHLARAAVPVLKAGGGGSLTAVTTTQGSRVEPRGVLSAAPKAAIEAMVRAIAREEAAHGVRANSVRAGWVDVGLGGAALSATLSDKARQSILSAIPMNRLGRPEEVAHAVRFLASNQASFITGTALSADGGQHL